MRWLLAALVVAGCAHGQRAVAPAVAAAPAATAAAPAAVEPAAEPGVAVAFEVPFDDAWTFSDVASDYWYRHHNRPEPILDLFGTCKTGGEAAYRHLDRIARNHRRWELEVTYDADCDGTTVAFIVATNAAGKKRYLTFEGLRRRKRLGTSRIPFDLDLASDEHVGVAFGLLGSALGCGSTHIERIAVNPLAE